MGIPMNRWDVSPGVRLPDLANKNSWTAVKFEFQAENE